jgi:hypothetical protein
MRFADWVVRPSLQSVCFRSGPGESQRPKNLASVTLCLTLTSEAGARLPRSVFVSARSDGVPHRERIGPIVGAPPGGVSHHVCEAPDDQEVKHYVAVPRRAASAAVSVASRGKRP